MTVSLGGLALSDHLVLDIQGSGVAYNQRRLIGGASVVQADGTSGGRTLTLSGKNHWTLAQVEAIRSLEATGQSVTLVHHRGTFSVLIVDATGLDAVFHHANPSGSDWYTGSIVMIEV